MAQIEQTEREIRHFSFYKGGVDIIGEKNSRPLEWDHAASEVREHLSDAMNARHVAFLFGAGCSSLRINDKQVGIPTMAPMATAFLGESRQGDGSDYVTDGEHTILKEKLGLDITADEYSQNLERLMEVLYCYSFVLKRSRNEELFGALDTIGSVIAKVTSYISRTCLAVPR